MSRAAILPFPGDPFLLHYWLEGFNNRWGGVVDKLYIYMNSSIEKPVVDYIREMCLKNPKINFTYNPLQTDHGLAIDKTLDIVSEEYVVLVEDDCFIIDPKAVDAAFLLLETGQFDVVGSKRGSCSFEILKAAAEKWGLSYEGYGDQGCNFWPNLFFCRKELLLRTDRNFCSRAWNPGETIEALGYLVKDAQVVGDTFVNTSLQIRALIPENRIAYIPQYHGSPYDLDHFAKQQFLFDGHAPWCHIGSLSSGVSGVLRDDQNRALSRRTIDEPKGPTKLEGYCNTDLEKQEWSRRVQWWLTFWEKREDYKIDEFAKLYYDAIFTIITQYKLDIKEIKRRQNAYATIGLW